MKRNVRQLAAAGQRGVGSTFSCPCCCGLQQVKVRACKPAITSAALHGSTAVGTASLCASTRVPRLLLCPFISGTSRSCACPTPPPCHALAPTVVAGTTAWLRMGGDLLHHRTHGQRGRHRCRQPHGRAADRLRCWHCNGTLARAAVGPCGADGDLKEGCCSRSPRVSCPAPAAPDGGAFLPRVIEFMKRQPGATAAAGIERAMIRPGFWQVLLLVASPLQGPGTAHSAPGRRKFAHLPASSAPSHSAAMCPGADESGSATKLCSPPRPTHARTHACTHARTFYWSAGRHG